MNSCFIEYFGLESLVERNDCENCPFKKRSECKKALDKVLEKVRKNYNDYLYSMNRSSRRKLTDKEKEIIYNRLKSEEIKKLLEEWVLWKNDKTRKRTLKEENR